MPYANPRILKVVALAALLVGAVAIAEDESGEPDFQLSVLVIDATSVSATVSANFDAVSNLDADTTVTSTHSVVLRYGMNDLREMSVGELIDQAKAEAKAAPDTP